MILTVAGNRKEYADGLTVAQLIEIEQIETPQYATVSVDDEFISGDAFDETQLHDGASVEFLYFMGGGQRDGIYQ